VAVPETKGDIAYNGAGVSRCRHAYKGTILVARWLETLHDLVSLSNQIFNCTFNLNLEANMLLESQRPD
jgi:hypothetical protein